MAKVTLVRPPSIVLAGATSGFLTPPIGLAYIGGSLRNEGHKVTIIDAVGLDCEKNTHLGNQLILRGISLATL